MIRSAAFVLWISFVATLFSSGLENKSMQVAASAVYLASAALVCVQPKLPGRFIPADFVIFFVSLYSALLGFVELNYDVAQFSLLFGLIVIATAINLRGFSTSRMLELLQVSALSIVMLTLALYFGDLTSVLSVVATAQGLVRFGPFGLHPNLTGFIFGGCGVLFGARLLAARGFYGSAIWALGIFLSLIFVIAASARAALLAFVVTAVVIAVHLVATGHLRLRAKVILPLLVVFVFGSIEYGANLLEFLEDILETDSATRGIGSGGTGRADLWAMGIELLIRDSQRLVLGGGFRSAGVEEIGFLTESSYINIFLELGVFVGGVTLGFVVGGAFRALRIARQLDGGDSIVAYSWASLLLYSLIQSIFNRYLLAIGNVQSLFTLIAVLACWRLKVTKKNPRAFA